MKKIRLIASDIDGTLLQNGAVSLEPVLFDQIRELRKNGILFLAASGREYTNLQRLFEPVKDDIAYLCLNGCLTVYEGKILSRSEMDPDTAHELISAFEACDRTEVLISGLNTCYIRPKDPEYLHVVRDIVHNTVTVVDDLHHIPEPYSKISAYEKDNVNDLEEWQKQFGSRITVQIGGQKWLDCAPRGVNKASGFLQLLKHLQIDPADTIMFGDNDNDHQILEAAGMAAAVENAVPSIKAICPYTAKTVPEALNRILHGEELLQQ